jgi:hypothetical protein
MGLHVLLPAILYDLRCIYDVYGTFGGDDTFTRLLNLCSTYVRPSKLLYGSQTYPDTGL